MGVVSDLAKSIILPKMMPVRQYFNTTHIEEKAIPILLHEKMNRESIISRIKPGMRIAITCGSRGISNIALITQSIVRFLKDNGAFPFIIPAMGSHGGATEEGQLEVLKEFGITDDIIGCPILSSMAVKKVGTSSDGRDICIDKNAAESDGIVVIGRVKPHTAFRGSYESGLMKMLVIGMGKQFGAEMCHKSGFGKMAKDLEEFGRIILKSTPVLFGIGILENALDETMKISVLGTEEIAEEEPRLLVEAKANMASIYFDNIDVLIVDQIGKNFSGDGMDPNITGNFCSPYASGGIKAERRIALDLSEQSHGCAVGVGMVDMITRRLFEKINLEMTYPNSITSKMVSQVKIPMILNSDKEAIQIALKTCVNSDIQNPRVVRLTNTLQCSYIMISEALFEEAAANSHVSIEGKADEFKFDEYGNLF